jgi:hypothetical protein
MHEGVLKSEVQEQSLKLCNQRQLFRGRGEKQESAEETRKELPVG